MSVTNTAIVVFIVIAAIYLTKWIYNKRSNNSNTIIRQIIYTVIVLLGALALTISLPIEPGIKGQIISLIGVVLSAAFALSSTTILGNAFAGIMNNAMKNFKLGDFISVDTNFGRVTKKGLFRTEIQTEDRNLTSIPNLTIASHPVKIIRETGTIISTVVSLGYDLNSQKVEKALIKAATESGLTDAFVFVTNLGDFSVSYKISGLLDGTDKYFSTKSLLNIKVMELLHKEKIEIVSPSFMNQRQVNDTTFIPTSLAKVDDVQNTASPESIVFDKANKADKIDDKLEELEKIEKQIHDLKNNLKDSPDKETTKKEIEGLEALREKLKKIIAARKDRLEEHK